MPPRAPKALPYYLSPGSTVTIRHVQYGEICATILPFSPSAESTCAVIMIRPVRTHNGCPLRIGAPYLVKIFDPRFVRNLRATWSEDKEAASARSHGHRFHFDPTTRPYTGSVDYEEDPVGYETVLFQYMGWLHHNECRAYELLAALQGSSVPKFYGSGTLDLSHTTPVRSISPFVLIVEFVRDAVPLDRFDARGLTPNLMRQIVEGADVLKAHGVIHTDTNPANFLLTPTHAPTRVVTIDFAESWTRDAAVDEQDWEGAKEEWDMTRQRAVMLKLKLQDAGLPAPDISALTHSA